MVRKKKKKKPNILLACEMCFTRYSLDEYNKEHKMFTMTLEKYNFKISMLLVKFTLLLSPSIFLLLLLPLFSFSFSLTYYIYIFQTLR